MANKRSSRETCEWFAFVIMMGDVCMCVCVCVGMGCVCIWVVCV